ncbi:valois [Haematobia irritans]|uniref:valois n=1 Tax=Haematobia irritans TaxID=7368 RepID=UPI003F50A430
MMPLSYANIYKTPDEHKPPEETDLADDTEYPNLNSRDYARRPLNHTVRMHDAWECISISTPCTEEQGNVSICCNKLSGREWTGTLWGFDKVQVARNKENSISPESSCFKLQCPAIINCMEYVTTNILILAFNNGNLQLWSTHSEVRNAKNPYCLFKIGERCEHMKPITSLATCKANQNSAITGSKDGCIKIWDMGTADLISKGSYRFAHTDSITAIATSRADENIFTTCSLDKTCLFWDARETRPAIALVDNHEVRFNYVCPNDKSEDILYLGDESGYVLEVDIRQPNQIQKKAQYFDRPVRKMKPNGENFAVIADSNLTKISKLSDHCIFYENEDTQNFIRDGAWITPEEFITIGFEGKLRSHKI